MVDVSNDGKIPDFRRILCHVYSFATDVICNVLVYQIYIVVEGTISPTALLMARNENDTVIAMVFRDL